MATRLTLRTFKHKKRKVSILSDRIDRSHRLGTRKLTDNTDKHKPRPIIIKFVSYQHRAAVYRTKRKFKGTGFTITESLFSKKVLIILRKSTKHAYFWLPVQHPLKATFSFRWDWLGNKNGLHQWFIQYIKGVNIKVRFQPSETKFTKDLLCYTIDLFVSFQFVILSIRTPKHFAFFASLISSLLITTWKSSSFTFLNLPFVPINIILVLSVFKNNLFLFNRYIILWRSDVNLVEISSTLLPLTDRVVSSAYMEIFPCVKVVKVRLFRGKVKGHGSKVSGHFRFFFRVDHFRFLFRGDHFRILFRVDHFRFFFRVDLFSCWPLPDLFSWWSFISIFREYSREGGGGVIVKSNEAVDWQVPSEWKRRLWIGNEKQWYINHRYYLSRSLGVENVIQRGKRTYATGK